MTRKEYETICRVLAETQLPNDRNGDKTPDVPSAEWMRRRIGRALCESFGLRGEAMELFHRDARLPLR